MRWEDERYVRVYTRDTAEWRALGWEAQALVHQLFRKVDRAGLLELGRTGLRGLADLTQIPLEVVERALPILIEDGCVTWVSDGRSLFIPNFLEAQSAKSSDKARQQAARERARDGARGGARQVPAPLPALAVTRSGTIVTRRHGRSRRVTRRHS